MVSTMIYQDDTDDSGDDDDDDDEDDDDDINHDARIKVAASMIVRMWQWWW